MKDVKILVHSTFLIKQTILFYIAMGINTGFDK